jgi:hypothetical protein
MVAFGLSLDVRSILRPSALVVVDHGSPGADLFERYQGDFAQRASIVGDARRRLQQGEVGAVITRPRSFGDRPSRKASGRPSA